MGTIIRIKCCNCSIDEKLYIGVGLHDNRWQNVIRSFRHVSEINNIADPGIGKWSVDRKIAFCRKCSKYQTIPVLPVSDNSGNVNTYTDRCECGDAPMLIADNSLQICRQCGGKLEISTEGYWD